MRKCPRAKYKMGDMVYSWENPNVKGKIISIRKGIPEYCIHRYKMRLHLKSGRTRNSKWHNEKGLSKRRKRK